MSGVRPGYKQTEVGVIPEDWAVRNLRELKPYVTSGSRGWAKYYSEAGELFVRITNLTRDHIRLDLSDTKFVAVPADDVEAQRTELQSGDLLVSITADIGIIGFVDEMVPSPAYINQHVACVRIRHDEVDSKFIAYFLASFPAQERFRAITDVGAKTGINLGTVGGIRTALPPLPEQRAVAEALRDADALIEGLEALIAKKRDLKQGAMQDLLTGRFGTGRIPLGKVLSVRHGRSQAGVEITDGLYPILATGGQIGTARSWLYDKPSVLIGRKGTIDKPQYAANPFWTIDTLFFTEIKEPNDPKYVFYLFCMIDWRQYNEASGVPSLNASTIESVEVDMHTPDEQRAIAAVLTDMDAEIAALEDKLTKARSLKQGMMQVLLTGEIRLR
jgi:type I restriction enzyme S subunit